MQTLFSRRLIACALCAALLAVTGSALAQGLDLANRPVSGIQFEGLNKVDEQLVQNAVRIRPGDPYDADVVAGDVQRLTHLSRFKTVTVKAAQLEDGTIEITYVFDEQMIIAEVQVIGNKVISDQELLSLVGVRRGDPMDNFVVNQGIQRIERAYEQKGYFVTDVDVDQSQLEETGVLIFRVREGPKVRITAIDFEGNTVYSGDELKSKIRSKAYFPIIRSGAMGREQLDNDVARLRDFYRDRGYLEAQVARKINVSPNQRDALVTFVIEEGPLYLVDSIRVEGNERFPDEKIFDTMSLKVGDVFSTNRVDNSKEALLDLYGKLGMIEANIDIGREFREDRVDVVVRIREGKPYTVGSVEIRGNQLTKNHVVLRQVRGMTPGRRFDREGIKTTERRLRESSLFGDASVTILGQPQEDVRDVLVEVEEKNTGSLSFGAGVSSDSGVIGAIELTQRNFDITDTPESVGEFITGKAFRGAGQYFSIALQPGNDVSRYSVTFREPYVLDSDYFLDTSLFYFERVREDYDEERLGGTLGVGQRFGDVWSASVVSRMEKIDITDIEPDAPTDVFLVGGDSTLTSLGLRVTRNTTNSRIFPTRGSVISAGLTRTGALGGDFDFTKASASFNKYWTVDQDFLGRETVFSMNVEAGWIFEDDEAPIFERFYAGGHRTMRGFAYRGVGPHGTVGLPPVAGSVSDDSIGGDWLFLLGFEYNMPIYEEILRWVVFTDTGTVQDDIGFDEYRISVGTGIRLQLPFLGQAPFAFDIAFPLMKESEDETQVFSFDVAVPF